MPEQKEINQTKPKILDFEQQEVKGKVGGEWYIPAIPANREFKIV